MLSLNFLISKIKFIDQVSFQKCRVLKVINYYFNKSEYILLIFAIKILINNLNFNCFNNKKTKIKNLFFKHN